MSMAPVLKWSGTTRTIDRPLVMGVVNASPDSFSDDDESANVGNQLKRLDEVLAQGADWVDIGGQSGVTGVPEIDPALEIRRIAPVLDAAARSAATISIDTYKPAVVEFALSHGAHVINDVSGMLHEEVIELCAQHDAGYVLMHNRGRPKQRLTEPNLYDDVVDDIMRFFDEKLDRIAQLGLPMESIVLDPGPDFSKTPAQTVTALRDISRLHQYDRPLLMALSRKDFIGAITGRPPRERLAGTLAAIGFVIRSTPASILRVHDIRDVRDFLSVTAALEGLSHLDESSLLDTHLWRHRST